MVADPYGIVQLKMIFYFMGIVLGWFAFYYLIDALKSIEKLKKRRTGWVFIYMALPLFLFSPLTEIYSYYFLGVPSQGAGKVVSNLFLVISSFLVLIATYDFKRHLEVEMMYPGIMSVAFSVFAIHSAVLLAGTADLISRAIILFYTMAFLFFLI